MLAVFDRIELAEGVASELKRLGVPLHASSEVRAEARVIIRPVPAELLAGLGAAARVLQPADRQVLALAQQAGYRVPVLTDDLALRQRVELAGGLVVGTVGLLVRSFALGRSTHQELEASIDRLLNRSTLHMSRPFRRYVLDLVQSLATA